MADWIWMAMALGIGLPLLVGATLLDVRRRRRTQGPASIPRTGDSATQQYLTQDDVDALPSPAGPSNARPRRGGAFDFGFAHPDFRTHGQVAQWDNATVLAVDGEIHAMRLLTGLLGRATPDAPLVVIASAIAPDVVDTLAANRRALHLAVLVCIAPRKDLRDVARWCGAEPLLSSDLAAGYVPASALGAARRWTSEPRRSWIEPAFPRSE